MLSHSELLSTACRNMQLLLLLFNRLRVDARYESEINSEWNSNNEIFMKHKNICQILNEFSLHHCLWQWKILNCWWQSKTKIFTAFFSCQEVGLFKPGYVSLRFCQCLWRVHVYVCVSVWLCLWENVYPLSKQTKKEFIIKTKFGWYLVVLQMFAICQALISCLCAKWQ